MDEEPRDDEDRKPIWQASGEERQIDADAYHIWTPRPVVRSVFWRPDPEPPRDAVSGSYEVFLDQRAFVGMHEHVWKADPGQSRFGYLIGDLCEDPAASRRFVIIRAAVPSRFPFQESGPEQIAAEASVALQLEVERRRGVLVGWYHSHPSGDAVLSPEDVATHDRLFADPWQVAFLFISDPRAPAGACFRRTPDGFDGELRLPFYEMVSNESLLAKGVRRSRVDWENVSTLDGIRSEPPPRPEPQPLPDPQPDTDLLPDVESEPETEVEPERSVPPADDAPAAVEETAADLPGDAAEEIQEEILEEVPEEIPDEVPEEIQEEIHEEIHEEVGVEDLAGEDDSPEPVRDAELESPTVESDATELSAVDSSEAEAVVEEEDEEDDDLDFDALIAEVETAGLSDDVEELTAEELEAIYDLDFELESEPETVPTPDPDASPEGELEFVPEPVESEPDMVDPDPLVPYEALGDVESELASDTLVEVEPSISPAEEMTPSPVPDKQRKLRNRILAALGVVIALGVVGALVQVLVLDADGGADGAGAVTPAAVDLSVGEPPAAVGGPGEDGSAGVVEDPSEVQLPDGAGTGDEGTDSAKVVVPPPVSEQPVSLENLQTLSDQVLESISTYYGRDGAYSSGEIGCPELQSSFVEVMDSWIDYSTRGKAGWQGRLPPDLVERDERLYLGVQDVERLFEASSCPRP